MLTYSDPILSILILTGDDAGSIIIMMQLL